MQRILDFLLNLRGLIVVLWYGIGIFLVLFYIQRVFTDGMSLIQTLQAILGLILIVVFFLLMHAILRTGSSMFDYGSPPVGSPPSGQAFPAPVTLVIGVWLLLFSAFSIVGFFVAYDAPQWLRDLFNVASDEEFEPIKESFLTLFAAGLGSSITTIMGYLKHASEEKNFSLAFSPWYIARPIMGLILGLIFYFVLKGGLLATIATDATQQTISNLQDLNDWAVASFGALVGLFSKNAIEKLRELFNILFKVSD